MPAPRPFQAEHYELPAAGRSGSPAATLAPIPAAAAAALGRDVAALEPWRSYPYSADALAGYLAAGEPGAPRFVIMIDGEIAGAVGLRLDWLRGPYLQFLAVLPDHQGLGLGSAAIAWLVSEARRDGARNLWVCASDFNAGALRFYERHGFVRVCVLDGLVRDERDEVLLRKRLA